ncbi:uncharacterized protein BYT42DRAFT_618813 [Radiomyces spectabilis]|uniref:uncharacterized protein n=1 Tax=Radiomyces spectabilis TaxID=64574 RepID=UPI00221EBB6A|nr:uncharacterized protein BYT42DRAFT_618813 [Radiomyces spectabilis]KAI8364657.1 hypothetical protein BYT42DRAFT_618813 [Radiomyces spectabilis]
MQLIDSFASGTTLSKVHWTVWAAVPVVFSVLCRKHGGFYYRSTVALICLALAAFYGVIASLTLPLIGQAHLINWTVARFYYRLAGFLLNISVNIEGKEHLSSKGPVVYVCNHQSSMDVLLMGSVFPKATSVVAKKSIKYYPILGWYMTLSKAIFLDRKNRDSAIKEARQAANDIHNKKINVWLFPEGTRGHPSEINLLPFKKGAFYMAAQAKVPIVPIVIANYHNLYSSKLKQFNSGVVRIKVLPPVSTEAVKQDSADIEKLSVSVREQMLEALKEISDPIENKKSN